MHLMIAEAGQNTYCSDKVLKSLTFKILKLDMCCTKDVVKTEINFNAKCNSMLR
jgi:hypothetical protein